MLPLNELIFNATTDLASKLEEIYKNIFDYLDQSRTQYLVPVVCFMVQSSFCANIKSLLLKLKKNLTNKGQEIISAYAGRTFELLYELLSNKNTCIVEDEGGLLLAQFVATKTESFQKFSQIVNMHENCQNCCIDAETVKKFR